MSVIWYKVWFDLWPPSERFSTWAGCRFAGTPETVPPDAHVMPSAMSEL